MKLAETLPHATAEPYFGSNGLRMLRGMRNRLAHNYLDIDAEILWETIRQDLPAVRSAMQTDIAEARAILDAAMRDSRSAPDEWSRTHLGSVTD